MSNWKVSKEKISLFTHTNADTLVLGKVGSYQVVVQKGLYSDGDIVVFAPEKSVLTGEIKSEFEKYLVGPNKDRVKGVRLRGEISSGIIIPPFLVPNLDLFEIGEDVSEKLGITHYEPPIPPQLAGKVKSYNMEHVGYHDCEHANIYVNELVNGERVIISEKIHGSQFILAHNIELDETIVSSKGLLKSGLTIEESEENTYWIASKNDLIVEKIKNNYTEGIIQIFGEVIPVQSGFTYGKTKPTIGIFDIRLNGTSIPYDLVSEDFKSLWVPIIYDGPINLNENEIILYVLVKRSYGTSGEDESLSIKKTKIDYTLPAEIIDMSKGMELVSGSSLHIREGIVMSPYIDRNATDGTRLRLKILNPKYKESGEEIN